MSSLIIVTIIIFLFANSDNKYINQGLILILCFLFASRPMDVPDTINYYDIFHYSMDDSMFHYEYGYRVLNYICHDIFKLDFHTYLFLLSFLMLEIWYFCTKKFLPSARYGLLLLIYMAYYGYYFDGAVLRNALAIMICYIGLCVLYFGKGIIKYIIYVLLVLLASSQHVASVLFLIIPIVFRKFSNKFMYFWIVLNFIFVVFSSAGFVEGILGRLISIEDFTRLAHYGNGDYENTQGISILFLLNFVLSALCVIFRDKVSDNRQNIYSIFLNVFMLGVSFDCITWTLYTASRIGAQFISFNFIPLYLLACESSLLKNKASRTMALYLLAFAEFFALIHYFPLFLNY